VVGTRCFSVLGLPSGGMPGCGFWCVECEQAKIPKVRIPLMADSDSIAIADSVPCDGGHLARVS